ncbi:type 4 pilus major pilin [Limnobacter sp.]|uniref:type 4 pilus major pilin n=1 Tax=Limnobacter sp. TaxID=2003368 RepID=UPI002FE2A693
MITSHTLNMRRKQSGITLIEVSIGLIIAAIVAAAAFIAFQNNARRTEVQDNIKQITEIISESKQKVGSTSGYTGLTTEIAAQLAILPADQSGNALPNSYNAAVTLVGTDADNATLTWTGVEADQCSDIVLAVSNGITAITGTPTTGTGGTVAAVDGTLTLTQASTVCGDQGAPVTLAMTFGRR